MLRVAKTARAAALAATPLGLSVFVLRSTLNDERVSLGDIFAGAAPYVVVMCLVLLAVIFVPDIARALLRK